MLRGLVAGAALGLLALSAGAEEPRTGGFWWGGMDIGAASLQRTYTFTPDTRDSVFALALDFGYAWDPQLLLGVELGGWTLEASDVFWSFNPDPRGEGIQTLYLMVRYYPSATSGVFVKAAYGNVSYWNYRPFESGGKGHGGALGLGKDFQASGRWHATPSLEYAWGEYHGALSPPGVYQDQAYRAVTLRLGFTYR